MSSSLEIIQKYVSENKTLIAFYFIVNIITLFLETIILSKLLSSIFSSLQSSTRHDVLKNIIYFCIILIIIKIGYSVKSVLYNKIIPSFYIYVRSLLYEEIIERYRVDYKELNLGIVQYNFGNLPYYISRLVMELLQEYIPNTIAIIFCTGYLMYINIWLGLCALFFTIILGVIIGTRFENTQKLSIQEHSSFMNSSSIINDKLNNLYNIYLSGTENEEIKEQQNIEKTVEDSMFNNYTFSTETSIIVEFVSLIFVFIVLYYIYREYKKSLTVPTCILIIILMNFYIGYLTRISQNLISIVDITGYLRQVNVFLNELAENSEEKIQNNQINNLNSINNVNRLNQKTEILDEIEFKNVCFSYPNNDTKVLTNLNFKINKNDKIAIYGQSGSGKSTIIKLILRFYEPTKGNILMNGIPITNISIDDIRKNIAVMGQNVKLFDTSIYDNIVYGSNGSNGSSDSDLDLQKYSSILNVLGPLDKTAGVAGSNLSGGQKQIINILRTLIQAETKNKSIIIFDEPTSALDANSKNIIMDIIKNINKTIIIITHDKDVSKYVNNVYKIVNGKIV